MGPDLAARVPAVRRYLEGDRGGHPFSGVVLVARGDDVVFHEAFGWADADLGVPMATRHRLRLGSLTKPITAAAVMVEVDRGRLDLDRPACELLPPCPTSWRAVTVRHLLTHTTGIADHFGDLDAVPVDETADELARVLRAISPDEPLEAPPGTEYAYSNFNYVLLGAVLESVTGEPWEAALRRLVLGPLGLRSMAYDDVWAVLPHRARGYRWQEGEGLRNVEYDDHAAYAAGGLLSTAEDVFRWSRGVLSGRLFAPPLVRESLTPYRGNYGYGWQIRSFLGRTVWNHTGGIDGFSSHLAHYPADDLTLVVLSNVENDSAILRACDVAALLFGVRDGTGPPEAERTARERCGLDTGASGSGPVAREARSRRSSSIRAPTAD